MLQVSDEAIHACVDKTTYWIKAKLPKMVAKGTLSSWLVATEPHADIAHDAVVSALGAFNPEKGKFSSLVQAIAISNVRSRVIQSTNRNQKCRIVLGKTPDYVASLPSHAEAIRKADSRIDSAILFKRAAARLSASEATAVFSTLGIFNDACSVKALSEKIGACTTSVTIDLYRGLLKLLRTPGVLSHMDKDHLEAILFRNTPASVRSHVFGRNYRE